MPAKGESFLGGELYDAQGNRIMMCDTVEIPKIDPEEETDDENIFAELFKDYSFSCTINPAVNKKTQKLIDKQTNIMSRQKRRIKRKAEQTRRKLLKIYGPERHHVMMRALRNVETYWKELHEDMIPIGYDDGNFHITMYTDEGGISVNVTEKYQGPIEVKVVTV